MSQPQPYNRQYNFANYQAINPSTPLPAGQVDAELNAAKATLDAISANLKLIQRDDRAIKNSSIGLDQLKSEVTVGFQVPTVWVTATAYATSNTRTPLPPSPTAPPTAARS